MYQPPPSYQPPPVNEQPAPPSPAPSPAPAAGPAADDMTVKLAQLQRLGELKAQGILTDEEFQAEKSKILGS